MPVRPSVVAALCVLVLVATVDAGRTRTHSLMVRQRATPSLTRSRLRHVGPTLTPIAPRARLTATVTVPSARPPARNVTQTKRPAPVQRVTSSHSITRNDEVTVTLSEADTVSRSRTAPRKPGNPRWTATKTSHQGSTVTVSEANTITGSRTAPHRPGHPRWSATETSQQEATMSHTLPSEPFPHTVQPPPPPSSGVPTNSTDTGAPSTTTVHLSTTTGVATNTTTAAATTAAAATTTTTIVSTTAAAATTTTAPGTPVPAATTLAPAPTTFAPGAVVAFTFDADPEPGTTIFNETAFKAKMASFFQVSEADMRVEVLGYSEGRAQIRMTFIGGQVSGLQNEMASLSTAQQEQLGITQPQASPVSEPAPEDAAPADITYIIIGAAVGAVVLLVAVVLFVKSRAASGGGAAPAGPEDTPMLAMPPQSRAATSV